MTRNTKLIYTSAAALFLSGALAGGAEAAGLKCECKNLDKCILEKGREAVPFAANNPNTYDADEKSAMQQADAAAQQKGEAAQQKWEAAGLTCPQPCDAEPQIWMKHGKPFAGATNGQGEGRSLWRVSYICEKTPQKNDDSNTGGGPDLNIGIGIGLGLGGGHHGDDHHGGDHRDNDKHDTGKTDDKPVKPVKPKDNDDDHAPQDH